MSEPVVPTTESVTETPAAEAPADFREYNRWRDQGGQPFAEEKPPAAAEETPPAKTEPPSEAAVPPEPEETEEPEVEARPGRGGSRQRRIDRLTRENAAVKLQLATIEQQLARMQPKPPAPPPVKAAEAPGKPKLQDFPTLEAYQEELTDWKIDQREAQKKAQAEADAALAAQQKIQTAWNSGEESARTAHPDYDEMLQSVKAPEGPGVMAARQAMLEDEAGPEILYFLATHPDELTRIAQLQPIPAVKEIGKLSASLSAPPSGNGNPPRKLQSAPKPPPPMTRPTGQTTRDSVYDEEVARDWKRWNRARSAQLKG